jgi:hypothetical protein
VLFDSVLVRLRGRTPVPHRELAAEAE